LVGFEGNYGKGQQIKTNQLGRKTQLQPTIAQISREEREGDLGQKEREPSICKSVGEASKNQNRKQRPLKTEHFYENLGVEDVYTL